MKTDETNRLVWKEGKYFVAQYPDVDISSFGDTTEEALSNLKEALELFFEDNEPPDTSIG